jgi:hypothetical protein
MLMLQIHVRHVLWFGLHCCEMELHVSVAAFGVDVCACNPPRHTAPRHEVMDAPYTYAGSDAFLQAHKARGRA